MFDIQREELDWCGRKLVLETGRIARQADGAVLATWGETTVLATVVAAKSAKPGQDFFPLTVHYQEKAFAAGRIPGGFVKREGPLSDKETLTSPLIARPRGGEPARCLFDNGERGSLRRRRRGEGEGRSRAVSRAREPAGIHPRGGRRGLPQRAGQGRPLEHSRSWPPHRRSRPDDRAP